MEFRKLNANEIDCRVSTVKQNGVSVLLYKDARVDQNILDEAVGPMNWRRSHQLIGDRLYCTVDIWDSEKGQWVSKQDVGTESFTEKEKGQASDSFKRACFNWGIGRELYTSPFIWINSNDCTITPKGTGFTCYDRFSVKEIGYDSDGNINHLVIVNDKTKKIVYGSSAPADMAKVNMLTATLKKKGISKSSFLKAYGMNSLEELSVSDSFKEAFDKLSAYPDKC